MKKKIIISAIILIVLITTGLVLNYMFSFKNINFTLSSDVSELIIYNSSDIEVMAINSNQSIKLQKGDYKLIPSGEKISTNAILISITKDDSITISPDYSTDYLTSILNSEKTEIQNILNTKYPNIISGYSLQEYLLFRKGEWFGGLLVNNNSDFNSKKDVFRFIANKNDGIWEVLNYPDLILTTKNYPTVPEDIIDYINNTEFEY